MNLIDKRLISNLVFLRRREKMTQEYLADLLFIPRPTLASHEEYRSRISLSRAIDICRIFEVPIEVFLLHDIVYIVDYLPTLKGLYLTKQFFQL